MAQLNILVGNQGSGKSTFLKYMCEQAWSQGKRRSLIIDPGEAAAYGDYPFIKVDDIPKYREKAKGPKIRRISSIIDKKKLIATIFGFDFEANDIDKKRAFLNGMLVMEDAASYLNSSMTEKLREAIKSFKQNGLTLVVCYHSIEEVSTELLRLNPHHLIVKRTNDRNVFSQIPKGRKLGNWRGVMEAYYRAKFMGLSAQEIARDIPSDDLVLIGKDLDLATKYGAMPDRDLTPALRLEVAKLICKWVNQFADDKTKKFGKYYYEYVKLRD